MSSGRIRLYRFILTGGLDVPNLVSLFIHLCVDLNGANLRSHMNTNSFTNKKTVKIPAILFLLWVFIYAHTRIRIRHTLK